jgi:hypothetical protein
VVGVVSLPFVSPPLRCCHNSTRDPPPKQLLMGLGAGGVSFVTMGGCGGALVLVSVVVTCFGGFGQVSMTQCIHGARWGLTLWVSPSWGLPALFSGLLTLNDILTSHLDGEEAIRRPWAWVGGVLSVSFVTTTMESKS